MRKLLRWLFMKLFSFGVRLAYLLYRAEGINCLLLLMPASQIGPVLRKYGATIGEPIEICSPLIIHNASGELGRHYAHLRIGRDCYFGRGVFFDLKDRIEIEDNVTVSMRVSFITHTDAGKSPVAEILGRTHAPIVVRHGAYIGAGATILQGVEIGECAVIGATALVRENVPPWTIVGGVPARKLGELERIV